MRKATLTALGGLSIALLPLAGSTIPSAPLAMAQSEEDLSRSDQPGAGDEDDVVQEAQEREEAQPLEPGEAVVTRFPHTIEGTNSKGDPVTLIDTAGVSVSILDVRNPSDPPIGQHWIDEPQRMFVTAADVGQVFGVAIAQRPNSDAPTIFVSATAAYGLHRLDNGWMPGMWGVDGGPGTIYRLNPANGYRPEKFADVTLDGRRNTGASLGNIAYDKAHDRLFVSDLETGMIHSLDAETGEDLGAFDHGTDGRVSFLDVWTQQQQVLDPVSFDPATQARIKECGEKFTRDPSCWNLADFRRRVWGLKVRIDEAGGARLYYSIWGSDAFGNAAWAQSGDDRRNSVWSIAIADDGSFDIKSVRREFFMSGFWPSIPRFGDKAGNSNPVADITFPECTAQNVMLVAERGGMRNLGLDAVEPFARPYESRVVRYELGDDDIWRPKGRYDVGFHDRNANGGEPFLFANAAGGVDFGYKFDANGIADMSTPSQSVWMTGDGLCSPKGPCNDVNKGVGTDQSEIHGLQGSPAGGFVPMEEGVQPAATEQSVLFRSYMVDTDINIDENGQPVAEELSRNDATKIGDVAIYQVCKAAEPLPVINVPAEEGIEEEFTPIAEPPADWPVHSLAASHNRWASSSHRVRSSWHYRNGSWHDRDRSWHYKNRSFHSKRQTWGDHIKGRSFHKKSRSWDDGHKKNRSYHVKGRTWDDGHRKGRTFHNRGRSWKDDVKPVHKRRESLHVKGRSFHTTPVHTRKRTLATTPRHLKAKSRRDQINVHTKRETRATQGNKTKPRHTRSRSRQDNVNVHSRRASRAVHRNNQPVHSRRLSRGGDQHQNQNINRRNRRDGVNQHNDGGRQHRRRLSLQGG